MQISICNGAWGMAPSPPQGVVSKLILRRIRRVSSGGVAKVEGQFPQKGGKKFHNQFPAKEVGEPTIHAGNEKLVQFVVIFHYKGHYSPNPKKKLWNFLRPATLLR